CAVDIGCWSVLYAFAVYALAFANAWPPGHAVAGSSVATAVAQISPARLTTAAHSSFPEKRPPASPASPGARRRYSLRSVAVGRLRHPTRTWREAAGCSAAAGAGVCAVGCGADSLEQLFDATATSKATANALSACASAAFTPAQPSCG